MLKKNFHIKQFMLALSVCLSVVVFMSINAWCDEEAAYKINDIIVKANELDGKKVVIRGEVIGDVMARKDHVWLNVQDGSGVMGVWAPGQLTEHVLVTGDYNYQGDWVEIVGTFSRADKELTGEICVRAEAIDIIKRGYRVDHKLHPAEVKAALILSILAAILLLLRMIVRRR